MTQPWATEVAPWFYWLQTIVMEYLERFLHMGVSALKMAQVGSSSMTARVSATATSQMACMSASER